MSSSVPSAVSAFISLAQGVLPTNGQVVLGATLPIGADVPPVAVVVSAVRFTEDEYAELGPTFRHEEHYNIVCCLYYNGGMYQDLTDVETLMTNTYSAYEDITVEVANNPTLGLSLGSTGFRLAWCRQTDFVPDFGIQGYVFGKLDFVVECQARVTSLS